MDESFLINGIKTRDKIVFDFIFHYYYSGLCAFAEKITGSGETAEDIVQDLFVTLWVKSGQIVISSSLKNYLFTSVKNRSLDFLRNDKKKTQLVNAGGRLQNYDENLSAFWLAESELEALLEKSLNKLPPRCREIFILSRFEGLKNIDIANHFNISRRTVELQISNALRRLREDLKPYFPVIFLMLLL